MKALAFALVSAVAFAGLPAFAADSETRSVTASRSAPTLRMTRAEYLQFRQDIPGSAEYAALRRTKRDEIDIALARIDEILDSGVEPQNLGENDKVELFNAHETVVAVLNGEDRERVVCQKRKEVGSHMPVVECRSAGERADLRERSKEEIKLHQPRAR
jgi:hypothetical protein